MAIRNENIIKRLAKGGIPWRIHRIWTHFEEVRRDLLEIYKRRKLRHLRWVLEEGESVESVSYTHLSNLDMLE